MLPPVFKTYFLVFWFFFVSIADCKHGAVHQCQPVRPVCARPDGASPEEGLPAGPQLHRGATAHGGREREAGEAVRR